MTRIDKLHREQEPSIKELQSKSNKKSDKVRNNVVRVSNKLKEQCLIWQKRHSDMESSSKNLLSKERARRWNVVQQQLDGISAVKGQLMEIIACLEVKNSELEHKSKCAKKAKCEAIRLYDKSKETALRCMDQLLIKKEEKKQLKDELTCVLIVQESQQKVIQEYESMVEAFKLSKLDLKCESKVGHSGGARWPLWVTEVCCKLLVHGSPPSAIPSSIATLFATLYGKEPKKLPLLNHVLSMSGPDPDNW